MVNKWIDKKTSLRVGKDIILRGEIVPDGVLSEKRLRFLKKEKMIEECLGKRELDLIKKEAEKEAEKEKKLDLIKKEKAEKEADKKLTKKEKRALEKKLKEEPEILGEDSFSESADDLISPDELEPGAENELE